MRVGQVIAKFRNTRSVLWEAKMTVLRRIILFAGVPDHVCCCHEAGGSGGSDDSDDNNGDDNFVYLMFLTGCFALCWLLSMVFSWYLV